MSAAEDRHAWTLFAELVREVRVAPGRNGALTLRPMHREGGEAGYEEQVAMAALIAGLVNDRLREARREGLH